MIRLMRGLLALLLFLSAESSQADTLICEDVFLNPQLSLTEIRIDYNGSQAFKILRKLNRVFIEYPRNYMEHTRTQARFTIPESRWIEIFDMDYMHVINELAKVKIYRLETYEDGTQRVMPDAQLLQAYDNENTKFFPNEWITTQRSFSLEIDRRILTIMEDYVEPAHVALILENGVLQRVQR